VAASRGGLASTDQDAVAMTATAEVQSRYAGDARHSSDGVRLVAEVSQASSQPQAGLSAPATIAAVAAVGLAGLALKAAFNRGSRRATCCS
jgi:hypothetical protein